MIYNYQMSKNNYQDDIEGMTLLGPQTMQNRQYMMSQTLSRLMHKRHCTCVIVQEIQFVLICMSLCPHGYKRCWIFFVAVVFFLHLLQSVKEISCCSFQKEDEEGKRLSLVNRGQEEKGQ